MIHLLGDIRDIKIVAVSGGIDSMVLLDFIRRGGHRVFAAYFNHHSGPHGIEAAKFVSDYCKEHNIPMLSEHIHGWRPAHLSPEEFWRERRYQWFYSLSIKIATAHHLNDAAETYLFGAFNGKPKLIPYKNRNVVRPFLLTSKEEILKWARKHEVPFISDPSNKNCRFPRNRIRHNIMKEVLAINPGFLKVIKRKYREKHGTQR